MRPTASEIEIFERRLFLLDNQGGHYDSLPLHKAIADNDLEAFQSLLQEPNMNVNVQDKWGGTPLFASLERNRSNSFVMPLLQAGCDVKISDNTKVAPLHLAMSFSSNEIAHELIKRGADINAEELHKNIRTCLRGGSRLAEDRMKRKTPLHIAVQKCNLEGVCMLLYYGADVYLTCGNINIMTALKYAAYKEFFDIVKMLIHYYDESYFSYLQVVSDYIHYEPYILVLKHEGTILLVYAFNFESAEIANILWNKVDFNGILTEHDSNVVLESLIKHCRFSTHEWLEYLFLILNVFITRGFTIQSKGDVLFPSTDRFFLDLMFAFHKRNIEATARLNTISMCISLDAPAYYNDLQLMHSLYGFGDELELFIYGGSYLKSESGLNTFICSENNCSVLIAFKDQLYCYTYLKEMIQEDSFTVFLGFYSLPSEAKQAIRNICENLPQIGKEKIFEKLDQIPEFPTLVELCRNQIRKCIKRTNKIKYLYHFHDAIKKLNTPKPIEDKIRFKKELY